MHLHGNVYLQKQGVALVRRQPFGVINLGDRKMKNLILGIKGFLRDEEGATAVEYGILVALIAVAIVAIVAIVGQQIRNGFSMVCNALRGVNGIGGTCS